MSLASNQVWSFSNTTQGNAINGKVSGPGSLTILRTGGGTGNNGPTYFTNAANAFNGGLAVCINPNITPSSGQAPAALAAGFTANGLTLGVPGGSATNASYMTITSYVHTNSSVGTLTVASPAVLALSGSSSATNVFNGGDLVRLGHSTLELGGPNGGTVQALFTNGIVMNCGIVAPWMLSSGNEFWTYTPNGLVVAPNTGAFGANTATQYVKSSTTSAATNLTGNAAALALYNNSNPINLNGYTLTIGDGTNAGLIARNNFFSTGSPGTIDFGTAEAFVYVNNGQWSTNFCRVAGTNGLVKFGNGLFVLASDTGYGGPIWLNNGTLSLRPSADVTYPGPFVGPGILTKDGTNALSVGGGSSIGTFTINGGAVALGGGYIGTFTVNSGATVTLGADLAVSTLTLGAGGTMVVPSGCNLIDPATTLNSIGGALVITDGGRFSTPNVPGVPFYCYPGVLMAGTNPVTGQQSTWDLGGGSPYLYGPSTSRFDNALLTNVYSASFGVDTSSSFITFTNGTYFAASTTVYAARATANTTVNYNTLVIGGSNALTGQKTTWNLNGSALLLGTRFNPSTVVSNTLVVTAGAVITNAGFVTVGNGSGGLYNKMSVTGGGQVFSISNVVVGASQSGAILEVLDSGTLWDLRGGGLIVGQRGDVIASGCWARVSGNAVVTNAGAVTVGTAGGNSAGSDSNSLTIADGGRLISAGPATIGTISGGTPGDSRNNGVLVKGTSSLWSVGGGALRIGSGDQGKVLNNYMTIDQGALVTNVGAVTVGYMNIAKSSYGNALTVTNGGTLVSTGLVSVGNSAGAGSMASNNVATVVGGAMGNSLWNVRGAAIRVGNNGATGSTNLNNSLVIGPGGTLANGGLVSVGAIVSTGIATGNVVTISGGSLECTGLVACVAGGGNFITNSGGIYQFTVGSPMITNAGFGTIALDNGVISFRNVTNANVKGNWVGSLTNIAFSGVNAFRLSNATNNTAGQDYVFDATVSPTNYAGLEMVGGGTAYTNASVTIAASGWLTFSNTAAVMWGPVTNHGTMRIVNSTVEFKQGLTLGEGCTVVRTTNSVVTVGGRLTLPEAGTLTLLETPGGTQIVTLFEAAGGIEGTGGSWTGLPGTHRLAVSPDGTRLTLRPRVMGFLFIAE